MSNFRLHTPEELQKIAEEDYNKFYELAKDYYNKDSNYYVTVIRPILNKIDKDKKQIKLGRDLKSVNIPIPNIVEIKKESKDDSELLTNIKNNNPRVFCTKCGSQNRSNSNYCFNCGNSLVEDKSNKQTVDLKTKNDEFDFNRLSNNPQNETQVRVRDNIVDNKRRSNWLTLGFFSAIVSIFFFPIPFGIFGVFCGYKATKYGKEGGGAFIIILSLLCAAIGVIYGITSVTK